MIDFTDVLLPHFNGLVREALAAQDAFDQWDEGVTFGGYGRREVDLDTVVREWDEANAELISFVLENGAALALAIEARRATTTKIGVVHESAGPKDNAQNMSGPSHE